MLRSWLLSGAYFRVHLPSRSIVVLTAQLGQGNAAQGVNLITAAGAFFFLTCLGTWYLILVNVRASADLAVLPADVRSRLDWHADQASCRAFALRGPCSTLQGDLSGFLAGAEGRKSR